MNISQLEIMLFEYNSDELFYQQYYNVKEQQWQLERFFRDIGEAEILSRRLIVPEFKGARIPLDMDDDEYFKVEDKQNIFFSKHNRYTPAFHHSHTFFEMIYVLSGSCTQNISGQTVQIHQGDFCMIASEVKHAISVFDDSIVINILIRRSTFEDIFFNLLRGETIVASFFNHNIYLKKQNEYLIFRCGQDEEIKQYIMAMYLEFLNDEKYSSPILDSMLMILFGKLLRKYETAVEFPTRVRRKGKSDHEMLNYIQANYQTISLVEVAEQFHFSNSYCSELIKEMTGYTFSELVRLIKLNRAENLLAVTNITINEISQQVGYDNVEHFNRVFKKKHGITPGQFRKEHNIK